MFTIQKYHRAESLEEAWQLNQKKSNRIVGGMLWMKMSSRGIGTAIDLCDLGLDTIDETEDSFVIGAMASLRGIELHQGLNDYTSNAVRDAVKDIVGVQFRNMATVGGSVWGRFGFSDVLTVLLSADTYVELYKGGIVALDEFVRMKYDNDILVRVIVKKTPGRFVYGAMRAQRTDFPIITCAVSCLNGEYRAVIGARPARAVTVRDSERILADGITDSSAAEFAEYVCNNVTVSGNLRGSAEYRRHLIKVMTKRSLASLGGIL